MCPAKPAYYANIFDAKVWISIFTDSRQAGAIWAVTGLSREPRSIPIKITLNSQLNRGIMAKKTKNIRLLSILAMFALEVLACLASQTVRAAVQSVQVGGCKGSQPNFSTIQAAVNAASAGATVNVCPGIYPEQVTIAKSLTLLGVSKGSSDNIVIVPPPGGLLQNASDPAPGATNPKIAAQIFAHGPATVTLKNIIIDGANNGLSGCAAPLLVGIYFQNVAGSITGADVINEIMDSPADHVCDSGLGIYIEANTGPTVAVTISAVNNFQKNGITASGYGDGSAGPVMNIYSDNVAGKGPTTDALQNGIQIGYGATGKVNQNIVSELVWNSGTSGDPRAGATGILVVASNGVAVSSNRIASTQFAIAVVSDPIYGNADGNFVTVNYINNTRLFDAIDICSNNNTVQNNDEYNSTQSGIHVDSTCTEGPGGGNSGNGNLVTNNNNNGACAGILAGFGTGNTLNPQILTVNVNNLILSGDVCSAPLASTDPSAVRPDYPGGPGHTVPFR